MSRLEILSPQNCAIALIDFQPQVSGGAVPRSIGHAEQRSSARQGGETFGIPTVLSTVEAKDFAGPFMPELTDSFQSKDSSIAPRWSMARWNFREAIRATDPKKLVLAGLTAACVLFPHHGSFEREIRDLRSRRCVREIYPSRRITGRWSA